MFHLQQCGGMTLRAYNFLVDEWIFDTVQISPKSVVFRILACTSSKKHVIFMEFDVAAC
jgi:hypothetical protein